MANYLSDTIKKLQVGISGYTDSIDVASIIGNSTFDGSVELKKSLKDKDGQAGTSGQILASSGTGVQWISAPPGGISVYEENTLLGSLYGTTEIKFVGNYITATSSGSTATVTLSDLSLDNLTDVVISSPSNNQLVRYNNSNTRWENWTPNFTLGDDTTGNYVANLVAGTGVTLTNGTASEGGTPTISIGQSVGTTDNVTFNNLTVSGALTINGSTTTINSTITTIDDPIITLGGDTAPTADDSKDRGIEFRWHDGSNAKIGFFGFDDSTGYLTYIPDATNSSEVFSGTLGDIQATNFRGTLIGNADTATKWSTKRTLTISGDVSGTATDIDGSGNISITSTLASSGVTAGTYTSVTVDSKGRVTSGTSPTTLGGYGIVDALTTSSSTTQSGYFGNIYLYDDSTPSHYLQITNSANLTAERILSVNVNDADRTISLSGNLTISSNATVSGTNTGDQTIELTGDVTGSGTGSFSTTLANSGVTAGTYTSVTVDAKGRVTAGTSQSLATTDSPSFTTLVNLNNRAELRFLEDSTNGTNYVGFKAPSSITTDKIWVLPSVDGTNGQALITDGSGNLSWNTFGGVDFLTTSTTSTQSGYFGNIFLYDDSTPSHYLEITNSANLTAQRTLSVDVNDANRTISLSGNLTVSAAATISGTNTGDQIITLTGDVTGSGTGSFSTTLANSGVTAGTYTSVTVDTKGRVTAGTNPTSTGTGSEVRSDSPSFTTLVNLNNQAELRFFEASGNGTNYVGFEAPANITANKIWILPNADGAAGQGLVTDGSGNLSWASSGKSYNISAADGTSGSVLIRLNDGTTNDDVTLVPGNNVSFTRSADSITITSSAVPAGEAAGFGEYNTNISNTLQVTPLSYLDAVLTFPSTAGRSYIIESIHVANITANEINITASIAGSGEDVTNFAYQVPIASGGALELIKEPLVAKPSDVISMWTTNTAYTGISNAANVYITYTEKVDTTYFKVIRALSVTTSTTIYTSTSFPSILQSIRLTNKTDDGDYPVSIVLVNGETSSFLVKDMIIPRYAVVEILDRPKRLATSGEIRVILAQESTIDVYVSGILNS